MWSAGELPLGQRAAKTPTRARAAGADMASRQRTRVISWQDQEPLAKVRGEHSGLEILRCIAAGQLPQPAVDRLFGWDEDFEFEDGRVAVSVVPQEHHYNPLGLVHGGVAMSLIDTAMGMAACSVLPAQASWEIVQMKTAFLRVITRHVGRVRCEGSVVQRTHETIATRGQIIDEQGRLYAHGTSMYRVTHS